MIDVLIPLKTRKNEQYELFKDCFKSYYQHLKHFDTRYIICDESDEIFFEQNNKFLCEFNINFEYVKNTGSTFYDTIASLIDNLKSKYFLFILDDVEIYDQKNILLPSIKALEQDENLIQIMLGGCELIKSNLNRINVNEALRQATIENITFNATEFNNDIIWSTQFNNRNLLCYEKYIFSYWNTIMRTDFFQERNSYIRIDERGPRTFHYYAENASFYIPDEIFARGYRVGWVNFEDYIYPHYRAGFGITKEILFNRIKKD